MSENSIPLEESFPRSHNTTINKPRPLSVATNMSASTISTLNSNTSSDSSAWTKSSLVERKGVVKTGASNWVKPGKLCTIHPEAICYPNPNKPLGFHCFKCYVPVVNMQIILGRNKEDFVATIEKAKQKENDWGHMFDVLASKREEILTKIEQTSNISRSPRRRRSSCPSMVDGMYIMDEHFSYEDYLAIVIKKKH